MNTSNTAYEQWAIEHLARTGSKLVCHKNEHADEVETIETYIEET